MSGSAMGAIQTALYGRLTGDATLTGMLPGGVKDHVPDNTPYEYVVIGEQIETPFPTFTKQGHENVVTLRIWSDDLGFKQAQAVLDRVNTLLHDQALTVAGHGTVRVAFEDAQSVVDQADDATTLRQIIAHYRITTQDN